MMDELKACPFCGSSNTTLDYYEISCPQELGTIVVCNDCGASAKSIVDWNTRPIEDALQARIAELEGIVKADNLRLINAGLSAGLYSGCDTAEMMAEEILASRARIAELEAAQRWRVVADGELPELRVGRVDLVYTVYGEIHSAMYLGNGWTSLYRDFRSNEVTHWMPLPESPIVYGKVCEE